MTDSNPRKRQWTDLGVDEQLRVIHLLTVDPEDDLDDINARLDQAIKIMRAGV